jgi:predicted N-acetyltransferase YhbS
MIVRPLRPEDAGVLHEFALHDVGAAGYGSGPSSALAAALRGTDSESLGLVATVDDQPIGIVLYGLVAGAEGTGRLMLLSTRPDRRNAGVGGALLDTAGDALRQIGARFIVVELPGDRAFDTARRLLLRRGFSIEATVSGFHRDDVDLLILRRELVAG